MAKLQKKYSFKNGILDIDDEGNMILTEVNKDDREIFNLTSLLKEVKGTEGLSLSFGFDDVVPNFTDEDEA